MLLTRIAPAVAALSGAVMSQGLNPPVSQTVFNNLIKYQSFAAASYANTCGTPPFGSSVIQYFNNATTDTQATLFLYPAAKQIVISFRGTSTPADFNTDFDFGLTKLTAAGTSCSACMVHTGFQGAWLSIQSAVLSSIRAAQAAHPTYSLIVTGHSLGGGIAAIASASLAASKYHPAAVYTYGEPRNGDSNWSNYIESIIPNSVYFRTTHANDGVPRLPPDFVDYEHHGTEYWQMPMFNITAQNTYMCPGQQNNYCNFATNYGSNPIDGAHISYGNAIIGNSLYIAACGGTSQTVQG